MYALRVTNLRSLAESVVSAAEAGGQATLTFFGKDASPRLKSDQSPVTEADLASNAIVESALYRLAPNIPCLSEESPCPSYDERRDWKTFWLVDPLDGTREFVAGGDEYTVNVALIENGAPTLGVIMAPRLSLTYWAWQGGGAWRKKGAGKPERLTGKLAKLGEPRVVVRSRRSDSQGPLSRYLTCLPVSKVVEVSGALKFGYLADGSANLYARFAPSMEWDVASGDCLLREAIDGYANVSPFRYNKPSLKNGPFLIG